MDTTMVQEACPPTSVTPGSSVHSPRFEGGAIESHIAGIAKENVPSGDRRMSTTSNVTAKSGRRRAVYRDTPSVDVGGTKSRLATPSGLVTEVNLKRHGKRDSTSSDSAKEVMGVPARPPTVDIENSDLETVIGDDDSVGRRLASLEDVDTLSRSLYLRKCQELGVIPIGIVVRKIGDKELNIRNRQCGPMGARAIAVPLVVVAVDNATSTAIIPNAWCEQLITVLQTLIICTSTNSIYNKSIVRLDLSCNNIEDEGIRPLCDCLVTHGTLRNLRLSENHLTIDGLKEIGRLVLLNNNITDLDISGNHFGDVSAKVLKKIIEETRTLKFLDLSNNNLGIESGIHIGQAIGNNESLEELRLCWNHIRRDGAKALADGVRENVRLRRLDVSWNGFGQETANCLSACFAENEGLVDLDLTGNRLNDEAMIVFAKGLEKNDKLEKLVLIKNPITNVGAFALLAGIKGNENSALQLLDMQDVSVRDDFLALLSDIQNNRDLQVLYNAFSLRPHILSPLDVLIHHIMEKGMDVDSTFDLIAVRDDEPPSYTEKTRFIAQLKNAGVPLTHTQLTQLANSLLSEDSGLVNLSGIIEAASDLQAETASAATSGTFDAMSAAMDDSSVAPSDESKTSAVPQVAPRRPARRERSPIQAGQQYSW